MLAQPPMDVESMFSENREAMFTSGQLSYGPRAARGVQRHWGSRMVTPANGSERVGAVA